MLLSFLLCRPRVRSTTTTQQTFNNPSTYVKAAKFQRLANAKEKELAALQEVKEVTLQDRMDATVSFIKVRAGGVLLWHAAALFMK